MFSPNDFEELLAKIKNNLYIDEVLELSEQNITDSDGVRLAEAIQENSYIKTVNLLGNSIKDDGAKALAGLQLESLDLTANRVGYLGARALAKAKIERLYLSANPITQAGAACFSDTPYILHLSLRECDIRDGGAKAVFKNKKLQSVDLASNNITELGVREVVNASALYDLNLDQNRIDDNGAMSIAKHKNLKTVSLNSNKLIEGAKNFSDHPNIIVLNLMHNKITGEGLHDILSNTHIKILSLAYNQISFKPEDSVPANVSLRVLGLFKNNISGECANVLKALAKIKTLEKLDLGNNNIDDAGAELLFAYRSISLKEIELIHNPIQEKRLIKKGKHLSGTR